MTKEEKIREYMEYMKDSEQYAKEFDDFVENHWALKMLNAPHSLVSVIETKIARAELYERRRIIALLEDFQTQFGTGWDTVYSEGFASGIAECLALIKGENDAEE